MLDQYGAVEAVKRAVEAGVDVLIQPLNVTQTIDAVVAGVTGRAIYRSAARSSRCGEFCMLKASVGLNRTKLVDLIRLRFVVGDSSHVNMANRIAEKSITLVKDSLAVVPL